MYPFLVEIPFLTVYARNWHSALSWNESFCKLKFNYDTSLFNWTHDKFQIFAECRRQNTFTEFFNCQAYAKNTLWAIRRYFISNSSCLIIFDRIERMNFISQSLILIFLPKIQFATKCINLNFNLINFLPKNFQLQKLSFKWMCRMCRMPRNSMNELQEWYLALPLDDLQLVLLCQWNLPFITGDA